MWLNDGDFTFTYQYNSFAGCGQWGKIDLADFDNDGDDDAILTGCASSSELWLNTNGSFSIMHQSFGVTLDSLVADLDGDLDVNIFLGNGSGLSSPPDPIYVERYADRVW